MLKCGSWCKCAQLIDRCKSWRSQWTMRVQLLHTRRCQRTPGRFVQWTEWAETDTVRRRESEQSERWCWRWTPCSYLFSSSQMPYNNRHKRSPAGRNSRRRRCRFCCGCCPNMIGCGTCCKFWGFLLQPGIHTATTEYLFVKILT